MDLSLSLSLFLNPFKLEKRLFRISSHLHISFICCLAFLCCYFQTNFMLNSLLLFSTVDCCWLFLSFQFVLHLMLIKTNVHSLLSLCLFLQALPVLFYGFYDCSVVYDSNQWQPNIGRFNAIVFVPKLFLFCWHTWPLLIDLWSFPTNLQFSQQMNVTTP